MDNQSVGQHTSYRRRIEHASGCFRDERHVPGERRQVRQVEIIETHGVTPVRFLRHDEFYVCGRPGAVFRLHPVKLQGDMPVPARQPPACETGRQRADVQGLCRGQQDKIPVRQLSLHPHGLCLLPGDPQFQVGAAAGGGYPFRPVFPVPAVRVDLRGGGVYFPGPVRRPEFTGCIQGEIHLLTEFAGQVHIPRHLGPGAVRPDEQVDAGEPDGVLPVFVIGPGNGSILNLQAVLAEQPPDELVVPFAVLRVDVDALHQQCAACQPRHRYVQP